MNLPESIRNEIADCTVRIIAPAVVLSMLAAGIALLLTGDRILLRVIPGVIAVVAMVPAWILVRKGWPKSGASVILFAFCLAIFAGMTFSGGVRAPAYVAGICCITMFIVLFGAWGGSLFALLMLGAGALFVWLDHQGFLVKSNAPPDLFYLLIMGNYFFLQFCFVLIPVRLMYKALAESRQQSDDLRKAVQERQQSQKELQSILNRTPDIIYRLDPWGRFTFISDAVRKYGRDPSDFLGKSIMDLVHPEDREKAFRPLHERRSGIRGSVDLEVRLGMTPGHLPARDGQWGVFHISNEGLYGDGDTSATAFLGIQGIARDVSKTKAYETQILRLAAVIEQAAEDVVITDVDGVIQYVNPRFEVVTGYAGKEVIGKKTSLFRSGKQDPAFYRQLWDTIRAGRIWKGTMWNKVKNGRLILQDVTITPIADLSGTITGFASVRRDITEQEKLEERVKQSRKMEAIGTLAGGIAHDFNNILGAILGYSELALADLKDNEPVKLYVGQIFKAGERAKDLVRQILLFSRQTQQEKQPVKVTALANEVIKLLKATLPANIEIKTVFAEKAGLVLSDPAQIHQIFMNLCTNAAHAMKEKGGTLTVTVEEGEFEQVWAGPELPRGAYLKIEVSDTGHGISRKIREKIFDPFFTTKSREEGTGMGLSVVYGIVENHGGAIHVRSEPGEGTTFTVLLPAVSSGENGRSDAVPPVPGGHEHLLFVDNEPDLVELAQAALQRLGYTVTIFSDSLAAWRAFQSEPDRFALVITDKSMPGLSGLDLSEKILSLRPDMPIIMCTGFCDDAAARMAEGIGIRKLLNKPIVLKDIGEAIRQVLDG